VYELLLCSVTYFTYCFIYAFTPLIYYTKIIADWVPLLRDVIERN